jgi:hypothetical protein
VPAARAAQALARVGSCELDLATGATHWSEESWRMLGVPPEPGASFDRFVDAVHPEDRAQVSYLKRLPVDTLKADRCFVDGLGGSSPHDRSIVAAVLNLASALGLQVVAEGVETDAQLHDLVALGVRSAQGYLSKRPGAADELAPWLVERIQRAGALSADDTSPGPRGPGLVPLVAEDGGFEPPRALTQPAFQASAIGH